MPEGALDHQLLGVAGGDLGQLGERHMAIADQELDRGELGSGHAGQAIGRQHARVHRQGRARLEPEPDGRHCSTRRRWKW